MGLARAVCSCDHEGCSNTVDVQVSPATEDEAGDLLEIARAIAEQRGWLCGVPGEPRPLDLAPPPGYSEPAFKIEGEGRDLCPVHASGAAQ